MAVGCEEYARSWDFWLFLYLVSGFGCEARSGFSSVGQGGSKK